MRGSRVVEAGLMLRSGVGLLGAGAMVTEPADEVVSLGSLSGGGVERVPLA